IAANRDQSFLIGSFWSETHFRWHFLPRDKPKIGQKTRQKRTSLAHFRGGGTPRKSIKYRSIFSNRRAKYSEGFDLPDLPPDSTSPPAPPNGPPGPNGSPFEPLDIADELKDSYLTYAMSVIVSRALPDVRDGLKPSQRRILVAMHDLGLGPTAGTSKSAGIVGETMKRYHPHGDGSIYPTLVRMAQDWVMRQRLVHGQGNFGSIAGLPPAQMRYTEARLTQ